jgi:hypothetical protein
MKKVLLIVALLTISLTSLTFAQATVGGWGRGIFVPVISADGDPTSVSAVSWGPGGTRVGFTISGSSDNVGMQADVLVDNGAVAIGDQQKIWVKPIEMLTITVGNAMDDTLRGNGGFVANNWLRYDFDMAGDDYVFTRVGGKDGADPANVIVAVTPVDGAFVYLAFGGHGGLDLQGWIWGGPPVLDQPVLTTMFTTGQYGAGYDIAGIGVIRAQYIGMMPTVAADPVDWGIINAAFKLTMVEGLMVDIGVEIPTDSDQNGPLGGETAAVALYTTYTMDTIMAHLAVDVTMSEEDFVGEDNTLVWNVGVGVEYGLENGPTIQGDVRYGSNEKFGGGVFAKWSYSNGIFGIGAQLTNSSFANWGSAMVDKTDDEAIVFAIPIRLEYWF